MIQSLTFHLNSNITYLSLVFEVLRLWRIRFVLYGACKGVFHLYYVNKASTLSPTWSGVLSYKMSAPLFSFPRHSFRILATFFVEKFLMNKEDANSTILPTTFTPSLIIRYTHRLFSLDIFLFLAFRNFNSSSKLHIHVFFIDSNNSI